jgi:DNA-binding response OmpR family regulator
MERAFFTLDGNWRYFCPLPIMDPETCVILIVEDEPLLRETIASHFAAAGWHVLQSPSAEEALELLADHSPAVVFTDIQLSGRLSGWDLGEACCEGGVPVLYTSGQSAPRSKAQAEGRFFAKPYEPDAVVAACARWRS